MEFRLEIIPRRVAGYGHNHFVPGDDRSPRRKERATSMKLWKLAGYG